MQERYLGRPLSTRRGSRHADKFEERFTAVTTQKDAMTHPATKVGIPPGTKSAPPMCQVAPPPGVFPTILSAKTRLPVLGLVANGLPRLVGYARWRTKGLDGVGSVVMCLDYTLWCVSWLGCGGGCWGCVAKGGEGLGVMGGI
jgi:hypothetical protein